MLDGVDLQLYMRQRVATLQDVPQFFRGRWRCACLLALERLNEAYVADSRDDALLVRS